MPSPAPSEDGRVPQGSLWRAAAPLVLASKSLARRRLLAQAQLEFRLLSPDVDERAVETAHLAAGGASSGIARVLAEAKALAASALSPEAFCLGADQTLTIEGRLLHKSRDAAEAAASLAELGGRVHQLTSAFAVARAGRVLVVEDDAARLKMRPLDAQAIAVYLQAVGPDALSSVGGYQLEGLGIHLFEAIDGDYTTILGLPMLKLLAWMRREGLLAL